MKKLLWAAICIATMCLTLQSMEEDTSGKKTSKKRKLSLSSQENKAEQNARETKKIKQLKKSWADLPPEVKENILLLLATDRRKGACEGLHDLKAAMLVNRELSNLGNDKRFIRALALNWLSTPKQNLFVKRIFLAATAGHNGDFFHALREADIDIEINDPDEDRRRALYKAVRHGHEDFVKALIDDGADVYADSELLLACNGRTDIANILLLKGLPRMPIHQSPTTLLHDVISGATQRVQVLIKKKTSLSAMDCYKHTALMYACTYGNKDLAELLLNNGATIDNQSSTGETALNLAVKSNCCNIVALLIEHGANLNLQNNDGETALMRAVRKNRQNIAELLIVGKADLNIKGSYDDTALAIAIRYNRTSIALLLINNGADVNVQSCYSQSILIAVCNSQNSSNRSLAQALIAHGARVDDHQSHSGSTALTLTAANNCFDLVKMLITAQADTEARDNAGNTALILAATWGNREIVEFLLKNGALINALDVKKYTPLMCAARYGHQETVELLLAQNADTSLANVDGLTALDFAAKYSHHEIVSILQNFKQNNMQN